MRIKKVVKDNMSLYLDTFSLLVPYEMDENSKENVHFHIRDLRVKWLQFGKACV